VEPKTVAVPLLEPHLYIPSTVPWTRMCARRDSFLCLG
jgi:hypothetical protein